jgi:hypothetical protein
LQALTHLITGLPVFVQFDITLYVVEVTDFIMVICSMTLVCAISQNPAPEGSTCHIAANAIRGLFTSR